MYLPVTSERDFIFVTRYLRVCDACPARRVVDADGGPRRARRCQRSVVSGKARSGENSVKRASQ